MFHKAVVLLLSAAFSVPAWAQAPQGTKSPAEDQYEKLPLKPERTLDFTTDEGTWMSIDVSPDGKTLLFDLVGQIYTLPIEGGQATRITDGGLAFNAQPKFSPDGQWIAFISDRDGATNLWVSRADGSEPKRLTKETQAHFNSPAWTPDGKYVVVSRSEGLFKPVTLSLYGVDGGGGVPISGGEKYHSRMGAVASADGQYLYFSGAGMQGDAQIIRRDRQTGEEDAITARAGGAMRPLLSPDGKTLIYGTRYDAQTGLRVLNLETYEERWLKYPVQRDASEGGSERDLLPGYAYLPGGREIVAFYDGKIHRVDVASGVDRIVPFKAHVSQAMGRALNFPDRVEDGPTLEARLIQDPVQSPDGKQLAFSALGHVYVMALPKGTPKRLTQEAVQEGEPSWSPDGRSLAYVTWGPNGGQVMKMAANGQGKPKALTPALAYYAEPTWSPDGARILFFRAPVAEFRKSSIMLMASREPKRDLLWVPSAGGASTLVAARNDLRRPHFSREKDRIYASEGWDLVSLRWDGTDKRTHLKFEDKNGFGVWSLKGVELNPKGDTALVRFRNQLYLMRVAPFGGEPPQISMPNGQQLPTKKLTDIGAEYFSWADGGSTITWSLGAKFFRRSLASVSYESAKEQEKKEDEKKEAEQKSEQQPPGSAPIINLAKVREQEKAPTEIIPVVVTEARYKPKGAVVLRGAQLITMKGDEVIRNADLLVVDNRIAGVGPQGTVSIPSGAKIIDVQGATIAPGFIDLHPHWNELSRTLIDQQSWPLMAALAYGVTTGRDPQPSTNDMFVYQDLAEMGTFPSPRAYSTGPGLYGNSEFQTAEETYSALAKFTDYYRTKFFKSYMIGNRKQRNWVVEACNALKIMPTTEGGSNLALNMTHALDGYSGNEHSQPIVPLFNDVAQLFAQSGITETPTLLVAYGGPGAEDYYFMRSDAHDNPKLRRFVPHAVLDAKFRKRTWYRDDEYIFPKTAASVAKMVAAGGRVGIGAHGELQGLGYHFEMWALGTGGMTNMQVLRAATLHGAEALGYQQDLGSIEVDKLADLVVMAKDPLQDLQNTNTIRFVVKNGQIFQGDTLDEVWPGNKPLPTLWFWNDDVPGQRAPRP